MVQLIQITNSHGQLSPHTTPTHTRRYVQEDILTPDDPNYRQFHKIFEAFKLTDPPDPKTDKDSYMPSVSELVAKAAEASKRLAAQKRQQESDDDDDDEDEKVGAPVIKS